MGGTLQSPGQKIVVEVSYLKFSGKIIPKLFIGG